MYKKQQLIGMALARFIPGILIISAILFIPAGSIKFWNAWLFMGVLFIPMLFVVIYLIIRDPELLFKRMNTNEKEKTQKKVVLLTSIIFLSVFIISGLDYINCANSADWIYSVLYGYASEFICIQSCRNPGKAKSH
jgi:hypothetical protein